MSEEISYIHFLKNKDFVRWQLLQDDELNDFWINYQEENPEAEIHMQKAIEILKSDTFNKNTLEDADIKQLFIRIQHTLNKGTSTTKDSRRRKRLLIVSSVAAVLISIFVLNIFFTKNISRSTDIHSNDRIVGNLLESKDIQLITEEEQIKFETDVQINVDDSGNAKII